MLAVFERRVIILGDRGVNAKVNPAYWDGIRDRIIAGIKKRNAGPAITEAIKSVADDLKAHFPHSPDDRNELPDGVSVSRN
jgi:putative membrane protein